MKILVLNGSPKEKSDTMVLTNAFLRGIKKTGEVYAKNFSLSAEEIKELESPMISKEEYLKNINA